MKPVILIIDDEKTVRWGFSKFLEKKGLSFEVAADGDEGLHKFRKFKSSLKLIVVDIKMPGLNGLELLEIFKSEAPDLPVVIITAFGGMDSTIHAMKSGAYDLLSKPFDNEEVVKIIDKVIFKDEESPVKLNESPKNDISADFSTENSAKIALIGKSQKLQNIFKVIGRVAVQNISVLITGETGVGKELIAQAIHFHSPRRNSPFIPINCTSIPEPLIESELFGHVKGAFTGAVNSKIGKFELADKGTLFLDEIGDMDYNLQSKLLRILQSNEFCRVGGNKSISVDIRIVSATNKNLEESVLKNEFRADLYHRLKVISINVPPLRERKEDIPILLEYFLQNSQIKREMKDITISKDTLNLLMNYPWPGNIRELRNTIESSIALAKTNVISIDDLPVEIRKYKSVYYSYQKEINNEGSEVNLFDLIKDNTGKLTKDLVTKNEFNGSLFETIVSSVEQSIIKNSLELLDNNQLKTANYLGINRNTLRAKIQKFSDKTKK